VADALVKVPHVLAAYTRTQVLNKSITNDPLLERLRLTFHSDNSGDVMVMPRPYSIISGSISSPKAAAYRTTHGSPHSYDTHVPLIVMGPGIRPGVRRERIVPQALAAIVSQALGLPAPAGAIAGTPAGVFERRR
jgi:hypothetical protein